MFKKSLAAFTMFAACLTNAPAAEKPVCDDSTNIMLEVRVVSIPEDLASNLLKKQDMAPGIPMSMSGAELKTFLDTLSRDQRTNVLSSPNLIVASKGTGRVEVGQHRYFLTEFNVASHSGQIVFVPKNISVFMGTRIELNADVTPSQDTFAIGMKASFDDLVSPNVPLFPITMMLQPQEDGKKGAPVPFTQFVQQPNFLNVKIDACASIPVGKSAVFVSDKFTIETAVDTKCPVLGELPHIGGLFKNTEHKSEPRRMFVVVTPQVIRQTTAQMPGKTIGWAVGAIATSAKDLPDACVTPACSTTTKAATSCCMAKTTTPSKMNLADVIALTSAGVSEEIILNQMRITESVFTLETEQIIFLKKQKVSDNVILAMQQSHERATISMSVTVPEPTFQLVPERVQYEYRHALGEGRIGRDIYLRTMPAPATPRPYSSSGTISPPQYSWGPYSPPQTVPLSGPPVSFLPMNVPSQLPAFPSAVPPSEPPVFAQTRYTPQQGLEIGGAISESIAEVINGIADLFRSESSLTEEPGL